MASTPSSVHSRKPRLAAHKGSISPGDSGRGWTRFISLKTQAPLGAYGELLPCAWRLVPTRPPTQGLRPSLRAPQSGSRWTWPSPSRQKAQLCHQGDAKGLRFWAASACADIRGMKGTQEGFLWTDVSRRERSRDATLDPALRKVRLTFAGRAWRRRGLELRTQRRAAGLRPPGPLPGADSRAPASKTGSGHHHRNSWPAKHPPPGGTSEPSSGHRPLAREEGPERGREAEGRESWPRPPHPAGASPRAAPPTGGGHPAFNPISSLITTWDRAY